MFFLWINLNFIKATAPISIHLCQAKVKRKLKIKLTGEFVTLTGNREVEISTKPTNVKSLLSALDNSYPNIGWDNSNVAINGVMYSDAWFQSITEGDEIVIMPPIEGG